MLDTSNSFALNLDLSGQENLPQLRIVYIPVQVALVLRWEDNDKLHDLGKLADSITDNGFKDPPKFEPELNNRNGGIVEGNGRIEALAFMEDQNRPVPAGILTDNNTGAWCLPILFGVDSASEQAAQAYAIDHNNLTLSGGPFTAVDASRMWGNSYVDILLNLRDQNALPKSVDRDDVKLLLELRDKGEDGEDGTTRQRGERGDRQPKICPNCGCEV